MLESSSSSVILALKSSNKGQLKYDRQWLKEGRSKEVLSSVAELNKIHLPKDISVQFFSEISSNKSEISKDPYFDEGCYDSSGTLIKPVSSKIKLGKDEPTTKLISAVENNSNNNFTSSIFCKNSFQEYSFELGHETCTNVVSYDESRKKMVGKTLKERQSKLEQCCICYFKQILNQIDLFKETQLINQDLQLKQLAELNELQLQDMDRQTQEMKDNQQRQAKRLGDRIKQVEQKSKEAEERQKEVSRIDENARKLLYEYYESLQAVYKTIVELLLRCSCPELLDVTPEDRKCQIRNVQDSMRQILEKKNPFSKEDFLQTQGLLSLARSIFMEVNQDINNANLKQETISLEKSITTEAAVVKPLSEIQRNPNNSHQLDIIPSSSTTQAVTSEDVVYQSPNESQIASRNISNDQINQLKKNHDEWKSKYQEFLNDSSLKKYRFDLQKAINTPINSISCISGADLIEKIKKLIALLSGRNVTVLTSNVSIHKHPSAIFYSADKLAMKLVNFSEVEVSSHNKSAFTLAAVAVSLWTQFPKVGELLLFHLYSRCPYLIPESVVLPNDTTDDMAMFQALGFLIVDGEIEKDDEFLKRMTGIVRFYAAILVTMPAPQLQVKAHPHGLRNGWQFLSRILRTKPWQDITATLLFHFLDVCGHELLKMYGEQFKKILYIICKDYFQLLKQESGDKRNGPIARLESFLQKTLVDGEISPPAGLLNTKFWYTNYT